MGFLRDYVGTFPVVIAVINGVLAAFSAHYPFKATRSKICFIGFVGLLSLSAIAATFYSQNLVIADRNSEHARKEMIREKLGSFINDGHNLMIMCAGNASLPEDQRTEWFIDVLSFLKKDMGSSYAMRFADETGIPPLILEGRAP